MLSLCKERVKIMLIAGCIPVMVPDMIAPDEEMREKAFAIFHNLSEVKEWMETQVSNET